MQKYRKAFLIGGSFSEYNGQKAKNLVLISKKGVPSRKLRAKGGFDGQVNSISVQSNKRLITVGNFGQYRGKNAPGIARLKKDGRRDKSFRAGSGFNASVSDSALRPDGTVLVGGFFTTYDRSRAKGLVGVLTK